MTKEQAIDTAVEWWADKLKSRAPHSNGDNGAASIFACFLADEGMLDISDDSCDVFKKALKASLEEEVEEWIMKRGFNNVYLGCDYNPSQILLEAANVAGISKFNFPFKTHMYIKAPSGDYHVSVCDGYGAYFCELVAK